MEGEVARRGLFPNSLGLKMTSSRSLMKHYVLFWALSLMEDINKSECDEEDGRLQTKPSEEPLSRGDVLLAGSGQGGGGADKAL